MLVHIGYKLSFTTPFHFGTGITAGSVDRTVIRDPEHNLYVPASTFKGVLREHCEQLCRLHLPHVEVASPHDASQTLLQFGQAPTLISRIFGSPLYPGTLHFDDAELQRDTSENYRGKQTDTLTQVRIDRLTGTAVNEALYTSEYGISYLVFEGTIKGSLTCTPIASLPVAAQDKKPTYSLLLLLAGLLMIKRLGGNKSAGKGQCKCDITKVEIDKNEYSDWQSWLEHLELLSTYSSAEQGGQA